MESTYINRVHVINPDETIDYEGKVHVIDKSIQGYIEHELSMFKSS
jgi:hypothetical protein